MNELQKQVIKCAYLDLKGAEEAYQNMTLWGVIECWIDYVVGERK